MARIDNLSNFLTDVADSIRSKTGKSEPLTPANYDTEIESISGEANLQEKSIYIDRDDIYVVTPDVDYDGLSQVNINVDVPPPPPPIYEEKIANPTTSQQIITPSTGYDALSKITINAIQTESKNVKSTMNQQTITPSSNKFINEVVVEPMVLETKNVTPSTSTQIITPTSGKDGISQVNVSAVDNTIDSNIQAGNIKSGVSILGVNGNVVELNGETRIATPTTSQQVITPSQNKNAITEITIGAVTSSIDNNIQSGNIKSGVEILGVTGSYAPQPNLQNKSIEITTNTTTNISADSGYDGLGEVSVTTNIPIPTIYPPDWSQIGYTSTPTDIIDSFNYSKDIYDNWDSTQTNLVNKFNGDRTLRYMPMVDTSNATDMRQYVLWM